MKTYLLDTINRIKRFSEKLDIRTALCNTPWIVFNDTGDKELFIFNSDGNVLITINGLGVKRTWQWVAANQSLIIDQDDSIIMLHPEYISSSIIALKRDGTNEYAFLIDENNQDTISPKTISELKTYFFEIEQKAIALEEETRKKAIALEEESKRKAIALEEEYKKKLEKERYDAEMRNKVDQLGYTSNGWLFPLIFFVVLIITSNIIINTILLPTNNEEYIPLIILPFIVIFFAYVFIWGYIIPKRRAKEYINKHPGDPIIPYIKEKYGI